ncbi:metallophosphoesterase [Sphingomonas naphthae]|uniref:Metallophosphoesterase n=1 Tax=Sphingomonas naphthae TaxID=1813468 RepID=A0ABY7TIA2_9SPHN|nr:metallophosphoesterase [Sphingomonas naphthae]WCT72778.1 metallophosphoesterase [Sphingomonas naphthae]
MTRLFHVSDLHFGRADEAALDWFAGLVRAEKPDAVVCTGDLTMRARSAEYAAASAWLKALDVPVTIEPGNHDLPMYNLLARFTRPYGRFERVEKAIEREMDLPGVWVVPLKTTRRFQWRNWKHGAVSRSQLDGALARLKAKPAGHVALIACHHPLVARKASGSDQTAGGIAALPVLAAAGATAVLSGHTHDPFDLPWETPGGTIRLVGAGTLSERVRASPPSFNELIVEDGALSVRVRTLE